MKKDRAKKNAFWGAWRQQSPVKGWVNGVPCAPEPVEKKSGKLFLLKQKVFFFLWLWQTVKVKETCNGQGEKFYLAQMGDADYGHFATYDTMTKRVTWAVDTTEIAFVRAVKAFTEKINK